MLRNEVFDINFKRLGIVEKFSYCQYNKKLYSCGTFSLKCPAIEENNNLIKAGKILWLEDDVAGIIQSVEIENEEMQANGNLIDIILDWRYIYPTFNAYDSPIKMMYDVVNENCINSENENRNYNFLSIKKIDDTLAKINKQKTGGSVMEFLSELGEAYNLGFEVSFNPRGKNMLFAVIKGSDRSINNSEGNKRVIFSESLNNLSTAKYSYNDSDYRNVTFVAGEATDEGRTTTLVFEGNVEKQGFERRELFVDARDLQSEVVDAEEETKMSEEEYIEILITRGEEKLAECKKVNSLEAEVRNDADTIFIYGRDYFLGDIVTIIKESIGYTANVQVTEITVTQDKNSYTLTPTFGTSQPTLFSILKKKGVVN